MYRFSCQWPWHQMPGVLWCMFFPFVVFCPRGLRSSKKGARIASSSYWVLQKVCDCIAVTLGLFSNLVETSLGGGGVLSIVEAIGHAPLDRVQSLKCWHWHRVAQTPILFTMHRVCFTGPVLWQACCSAVAGHFALTGPWTLQLLNISKVSKCANRKERPMLVSY